MLARATLLALVLAVAGALAAWAGADRSAVTASACPRPGHEYRPAAGAPLLAGVVSDPYSVDDVGRRARTRFTAYANFEHWSFDRSPERYLRAARARDLTPVVTWEPWRATEPGDPARQGAAQPEYANAGIAAGEHDAYLATWARAVRAFGGPVYIRLAHEMNADWYPWSHEPREYRRMWRHVVTLFRTHGASNARFVFAPNPNTAQDEASWCGSWQQYWPGSRFVDAVGMTTIDFGGEHAERYSVDVYASRLRVLRRLGRPVLLPEVNVAYGERVRWLTDLRRFVTASRWVTGFVISQAPSRGVVADGDPQRLNWDFSLDAEASRQIRDLIAARTPASSQRTRQSSEREA